jgi:hypothetical protein
MRPGINQNIPHKGTVYHVQTEDGGMKNPFITTVLFKDGAILASKRTGYADILRSDKLDIVINELMREQHVSFVKDLKKGRFDKGPSRNRARGGEIKEATNKENAPEDAKDLDDIILERLSLDK